MKNACLIIPMRDRFFLVFFGVGLVRVYSVIYEELKRHRSYLSSINLRSNSMTYNVESLDVCLYVNICTTLFLAILPAVTEQLVMKSDYMRVSIKSVDP